VCFKAPWNKCFTNGCRLAFVWPKRYENKEENKFMRTVTLYIPSSIEKLKFKTIELPCVGTWSFKLCGLGIKQSQLVWSRRPKGPRKENSFWTSLCQLVVFSGSRICMYNDLASSVETMTKIEILLQQDDGSTNRVTGWWQEAYGDISMYVDGRHKLDSKLWSSK